MKQQVVTVTVEVPEGYRILDFREPKSGELYLLWSADNTPYVNAIPSYAPTLGSRFVLERVKRAPKVGEVWKGGGDLKHYLIVAEYDNGQKYRALCLENSLLFPKYSHPERCIWEGIFIASSLQEWKEQK